MVNSGGAYIACGGRAWRAQRFCMLRVLVVHGAHSGSVCCE